MEIMKPSTFLKYVGSDFVKPEHKALLKALGGGHAVTLMSYVPPPFALHKFGELLLANMSTFLELLQKLQ